MSQQLAPVMDRHRHLSKGLRVAAALALVLGLGGAPSLRAEDPGRLNLFGHHYSVIAGASVYVPGETATRSIYGRHAFAPVLDLCSFTTRPGLGVAWDLGRQQLNDQGRKAQYLHAGGGPRVLFAPASAAFAPYLTVRGGLYVARLDQGDWRTAPGANVELGAFVVRHLVLSGRYDAVRKTEGVNLSGFSVRAAVKVF
jgi:hypothetical protein